VHRELYAKWQDDLIPHLAQVILYSNNATYDKRRKDEASISDTDRELIKAEARAKAKAKGRRREAGAQETAAVKVNKMFAGKIGEAVAEGGAGSVSSSERYRFDGKKLLTRKQAFEISVHSAKMYTVHYTLLRVQGGMHGVGPPPIFQLKQCYPTDQALYKLFKEQSTAGTANIAGYISSYVINWYEHHVLKLFDGERLWEKCRDENNELYYHNKKTGATVREKPEDIDALLTDGPGDETKAPGEDESADSASPLPGSPTSVAAIGSIMQLQSKRRASRKPSSAGAKSSRKSSSTGAKSGKGKRKPSKRPLTASSQ
jgi:hypothetical protein